MKYIIIAVLALTFTSCSNFGEKLNFGKNELYYTKNVTKSDAEKLGNYLTEQQFFSNDGNTISVQLDKVNDTFLFRMVTLDSALNNTSFVENAKVFPAMLSENVFNKKPVVMHLCDNRFNLEKVVRP